MKRNLCIIFIFSGLQISAIAQSPEKEITHQQLYWIRYYNKLIVNDQWSVHTEIEDRRYFDHNRQDQWLVPRVNIQRRLGNSWASNVGFTYFLQSLPVGPDDEVELMRPELRPQVGVATQQKLEKASLSHRYNLEGRFFRKTQGNELISGYDFNLRLRYKLQFIYPLIDKETAKGKLQAIFFDEVMFNLGHRIVRNTFDQNRIGGGLNYGFMNDLQVQLEYFNWFQQRKSGNEYYSRNIWRLTLYHTMHLKNFHK